MSYTGIIKGDSGVEEKYTSNSLSVNADGGTTINFYYTSNKTKNPVYPEAGAVIIDKTATNDDSFRKTGITNVNLKVSGVPVHKGVDVVILMDTSTSMTDNKISYTNHNGVTSTVTRLAAAQSEFAYFTDTLMASYDDGAKSKSRISVVQFSGWGSSSHNGTGNKTLQSNGQWTANGGTESTNVWFDHSTYSTAKTAINSLTTNSGTDYDYPLSQALSIINNRTDKTNDVAVLFLTDGAPSLFTSKTGATTYQKYQWSSTGVDAYNDNVLANPFNYYAEQIKAMNIPLYAIGLGVSATTASANNGFEKSEALTILQRVSSDYKYGSSLPISNGYMYDCTTGAEFSTAVQQILTKILVYAGMNATAYDTISSEFELWFDENHPIKIVDSPVYTIGDYEAGVINDYNLIGARNPNKPEKVIEKIYKENGKVYSSILGQLTVAQDGSFNGSKIQYMGNRKTFVWNIDVISMTNLSLNFYEYLKGTYNSLGNDGTDRKKGLYDTNERATLVYNNHLNNPTTLVFQQPKLPWPDAMVGYEYYLANDKGQPINYLGNVIPWAYRIIVQEVTWQSINATGIPTTIKAVDKATGTWTSTYDILDKTATYTVKTNLQSDTDKGSGVGTGVGTVVTSAEGTRYTASVVSFAVTGNLGVGLNKDTVVLDYSKPIKIDVLSNDNLYTPEGKQLYDLYAVGNGIQSGITAGTQATKELALTGKVTKTSDSSSTPLTYGNVSFVKNDNGEVVPVYTLQKYMNGIDRFYYATQNIMNDTDPSTADEEYLYQLVTVIPATMVYYEDDFGNTSDNDTTNGIVFSGNWSSVGTATGGYQDDGTLGNNSPYGYDSSYDNDTKFSNGTASVVTGTGDTTAKFTFSGTGFDLISRTDNNTGMVQVVAYSSDGKIAQKTMNVTQTTQEGLTLYQIPIIKMDLGKYDTYTVEIKVLGENVFTKNTTFYLDAIRIYNPIDPNSADANEANAAYRVDKEGPYVIKEFRNYMLDDGSKLENDSYISNIVFVDGNSEAELKPGQSTTTPTQGTTAPTSGNNANVVDGSYSNVGPNNEVYLATGQSIGFTVKPTEGTPIAFQVGAKAPNMQNENLAKMIVGGEPSSLALNGSSSTGALIAIDSATEMFYDVTTSVTASAGGYMIIITNAGTSLLALTSLKVVFKTADQSNASLQSAAAFSYASNYDVLKTTYEVTKLRMDEYGSGEQTQPTTAVSTTEPETFIPLPDFELGDVDQDGRVSIKDVTLIQQATAGLTKFTEYQNETADFNEDNIVNIKDATAIQKKLAGL